MKKITATNNLIIKNAQKLTQAKYQRKNQLFLVEGKHLVAEARKNGVLKMVFTTNPNYDGIIVTAPIMKKLSTTKTPVDVIGVCKMKQSQLQGDRILALDNIQDPGNLGTLIRTARAFGWSSVLITGVDHYNPKVIRATQGAMFSIKIVQTNDLTKHFRGYEVIAATVQSNCKRIKFDHFQARAKKLMLVLGNEGQGISAPVLKLATTKIYIPVQFESLNIAQAGAILLHTYQKNGGD